MQISTGKKGDTFNEGTFRHIQHASPTFHNKTLTQIKMLQIGTLKSKTRVRFVFYIVL